jgi:hypothetical protein
VSPPIIKLIPIKQIRQGPAELGVRRLDLSRGGVFNVQEAEGLADSVQERHSVGNRETPSAPGQDKRSLEKPDL